LSISHGVIVILQNVSWSVSYGLDQGTFASNGNRI